MHAREQITTLDDASGQGTPGLRDVVIAPSFQAWRAAARALLRENVAPERVVWRERHDETPAPDGRAPVLLAAAGRAARVGALSGGPVPAGAAASARTPYRVPKAFVGLAGAVACHRDPARWDVLYRVLWRLVHGESALLESATDPDLQRATVMARAVRRELRRMLSSVRFRAVEASATGPGMPPGETRVTYVAWYEPAHRVVERAAPLMLRRFRDMRWSVLTPDLCAHWDGAALRFTPGVATIVAPSDERLERLWRGCYAGFFLPSHLSVAARTRTAVDEEPSLFGNLSDGTLASPATDMPGRDASGRDASRQAARMLAGSQAPVGRSGAGMLSRVPGRVTMTELHRVAATPPVASPLLANEIGDDLDAPGAWDPTHDPGVCTARARAAAVRLHASEGLTLLGVPVCVGTASWTDPTITGPGVFYPDDVCTPDARLRYYAERFSMAEVDSTFYLPPSRAMSAAWAARSPAHFVFDVKAYSLMTGHSADTKRIPEWLRVALPASAASKERIYARDLPTGTVDSIWQRFLDGLQPLREANKLGPIVLQFPRWFAPTRESADALTIARERLGDAPAAVEFRNPAWVTGKTAARTFALLERLRLTYVIVDTPQGTASSVPPVVGVTTPDLAMVRLHGRRRATWEARHAVLSERHRYLYDREELAVWAERITELAAKLRPVPLGSPDPGFAAHGVHVVQNNCHANYATTNADELTELLIEYDQERLQL